MINTGPYLTEAFSKSKTSQLPPHRSWDCAIDLLPGCTPPIGRIFPLSQPESEAMKTYTKEELAKGFIRPSTLPVSAGFFVGKIDGGLHPCMDYHGLNEITVKWSCLWFLQPWNSSEWPNTSANSICAVHTTSFTSAKEMNGREHSQPTQGTMSTWLCRSGWSIVHPWSSLSSMISSGTCWFDGWLSAEHVRHVRAILQCLISHQLCNKAEKCEFQMWYVLKEWPWMIAKYRQFWNGHNQPLLKNCNVSWALKTFTFVWPKDSILDRKGGLSYLLDVTSLSCIVQVPKTRKLTLFLDNMSLHNMHRPTNRSYLQPC